MMAATRVFEAKTSVLLIRSVAGMGFLIAGRPSMLNSEIPYRNSMCPGTTQLGGDSGIRHFDRGARRQGRNRALVDFSGQASPNAFATPD